MSFLVCTVFALASSPQARVKNEMVMVPGASITATTKAGKIVITAVDTFTRSYTWDGATRSAELYPRAERWYGSLGAYYPGPGDHWREHKGITRGVLEEGQQHFKSVGQAMQWIKGRAWIPHVYSDSGLFVGFGKTLERRQLEVEVFQLYINGKKPTRLAGSSNGAISVTVKKPPAAKDSLTVAVRANDYASVKRLLAAGADPNVRNAAGSPALTVASARGYVAVVKALLAAGADPNARNPEDEGATPLLKSQNHEITEALLKKGADPNVAYTSGILAGHTPLMGAAMIGDLKGAKILLEAGAKAELASKQGDTPLHWAARGGNLELIKLLLDKGAPVNARDYLGTSPLMYAVQGGTRATLPRKKAIVSLLISRGANVNARMDLTRLEYFRAAFVGDKASMARIEKSGKLEKLHDDGSSVLDHAGLKEIRDLLRKAGAKG